MNIYSNPGSGLSTSAIAGILRPFYSGLSEVQLGAIQDYIALLLKWNQSMNLTAIEDAEEIVARHFGESLFAASLVKIGESRLADVGTGAGFPGMAIKIAFPGARLTLFESSAKKRAFLAEVARELKLSDVNIMRGRYEEFSVDDYDFVCSRALGNYSVFIPWALRSLRPGGQVVLWLGADESVRISRKTGFHWESPVPIPGSRKRVILLGRKQP